MPARGKSRVTAAQRAAVAVGKAAGKTRAEIAEDTGLAPSTISAVAAKPETKGIIDRLFAEQHELMAGLMVGIVESLKADIAPGSKLSPEQRHTARQQAVSVLQLGQPPEPPPSPAGPGAGPGGGAHLTDWLVAYRSITQGGAE